MRIEGRNLVDFGERKLHLGSERREVRGGEVPMPVLDEMQMLDQEIAPARRIAKQRAHLIRRRGINLATLRGLWRAALAADAVGCGWHDGRVH